MIYYCMILISCMFVIVHMELLTLKVLITSQTCGGDSAVEPGWRALKARSQARGVQGHAPPEKF